MQSIALAPPPLPVVTHNLHLDRLAANIDVSESLQNVVNEVKHDVDVAEDRRSSARSLLFSTEKHCQLPINHSMA